MINDTHKFSSFGNLSGCFLQLYLAQKRANHPKERGWAVTVMASCWTFTSTGSRPLTRRQEPAPDTCAIRLPVPVISPGSHLNTDISLNHSHLGISTVIFIISVYCHLYLCINIMFYLHICICSLRAFGNICATITFLFLFSVFKIGFICKNHSEDFIHIMLLSCRWGIQSLQMGWAEAWRLLWKTPCLK